MSQPFNIPTNYNFRVLLEPKGFIRLIEFVIAIFAFATCCGYTGVGFFTATCAGGHVPYTFRLNYPFRLTETVQPPIDVCNTTSGVKPAVIGSEGSSQFFVFVGVWSFLTCLATCILYVVFDELSQVMTWIPQADFSHSLLIALMWLIASSAWAQGLNDIKYQTSAEAMMNRQPACQGDKVKGCKYTPADYASLNVSVIFGFLCMAVWAGNLWFLFKETKWFKAREQNQPGAIQGTGLPPAPAPSSSGSGLPSYPNASPFAPPSDPAYMQQAPQSRI